MPFGLGFFATAGVSAAAGSFDLLESQVLTGSQASIEFTNLSSKYASTYQHLQLRMTLRTDRAGQSADLIWFYYNSDTTDSNYSTHRLSADGSTVSSSWDSAPVIAYCSGATDTANKFTGVVMDILDPFETTKFKTSRFLLGQGSADRVLNLNSSLWRNTNALSSVKFDPLGNFVTGSRFSLYGIKGA